MGDNANRRAMAPKTASRARRAERVFVAHDRHDRRPGPGASTGLPQRPVHERAAWLDMNLARFESRHFAGQFGEPSGAPRRAQNLRDGVALFVGEAEARAALVGIVGAVHDDVEIAAAPGDDADSVTLLADEF